MICLCSKICFLRCQCFEDYCFRLCLFSYLVAVDKIFFAFLMNFCFFSLGIGKGILCGVVLMHHLSLQWNLPIFLTHTVAEKIALCILGQATRDSWPFIVQWGPLSQSCLQCRCSCPLPSLIFIHLRGTPWWEMLIFQCKYVIHTSKFIRGSFKYISFYTYFPLPDFNAYC